MCVGLECVGTVCAIEYVLCRTYCSVDWSVFFSVYNTVCVVQNLYCSVGLECVVQCVQYSMRCAEPTVVWDWSVWYSVCNIVCVVQNLL